jgi:hypothetical protein
METDEEKQTLHHELRKYVCCTATKTKTFSGILSEKE